MDKTQLIKRIEAVNGKQKVLELSRLLIAKNLNLQDVIAITLHPDPHISFKAAWLLENLYLKHSETYLPYLELLLSQIPMVKAPGSKRHYAKIIMHITDSHAPQVIKDEAAKIDFEQVVEQLFDWLIDPKIKIAVKAFAAEALFNLRHRYDWITDELTNQLHFLMRGGSAAIQSKGKKLLKALK